MGSQALRGLGCRVSSRHDLLVDPVTVELTPPLASNTGQVLYPHGGDSLSPHGGRTLLGGLYGDVQRQRGW